ncbi:alpha/beta hydrolase [Paenibacillus sp. P25]|nr:alpha/beta hydrolase [Paenibacillus sp. P25]
MDKQFADMKGKLRLAYTDQGEGTPVVLLHGFCGSSAYWDEVLPLLQGRARLIVPDLRGHGDSGAPDEPYGMETLADDIAGLLEELQLSKAVLIGHSLGGYATLAFAEKYPERLLAFGLIHSTAYQDDDKGKQGRLNSMETIRTKGLPAFVEGLIPRLFAPAHVETMKDAVELAKQIGRGTSPDGAIRTLEGMRTRPDRGAVLKSAKVPLLLVAGEHDQLIPSEKTFTVEGGGVTQVKLAEAGHMSMMEAPDKLAEAIGAFVSKL